MKAAEAINLPSDMDQIRKIDRTDLTMFYSANIFSNADLLCGLNDVYISTDILIYDISNYELH